MKFLLDLSPAIPIRKLAGARLHQILRRLRIVVALIPLVDSLPVGYISDLAAERGLIASIVGGRIWTTLLL
jgi:hypothetical protein